MTSSNGRRRLSFQCCPVCPGPLRWSDTGEPSDFTLEEVNKLALKNEQTHVYVVYCAEHSGRMPRSRKDTEVGTGKCECGHSLSPYHTTPNGSCWVCANVGRHCAKYVEGVKPV